MTSPARRQFEEAADIVPHAHSHGFHTSTRIDAVSRAKDRRLVKATWQAPVRMFGPSKEGVPNRKRFGYLTKGDMDPSERPTVLERSW
jgi:hypothetical protein